MARFAINGNFLSKPIGGIQRMAAQITTYLHQKYPDASIYAPHDIAHPELLQRLKANVSPRRQPAMLWEHFTLPAQLRKQGSPYLLNFFNVGPLGYDKNILFVHDAIWLDRKYSLAKEYYLFRFFRKPVVKKASRIITVSEFSKKDIAARLGIPEERISVVYLGVDKAKFSMNERTDNRRNYILTVSTLVPRKNISGLAEAFVRANLPDTELIIVGQEPRLSKDWKLGAYKKHPRIRFVGRASDQELIDLYQHAKMFVFPSFSEGFGLPPLEAMACGSPVLASNATCIPEICGDAASYFDPYDVEDLKEKMIALFHDDALKQRLIAEGRKRVDFFSWEKTHAAMSAFLETL